MAVAAVCFRVAAVTQGNGFGAAENAGDNMVIGFGRLAALKTRAHEPSMGLEFLFENEHFDHTTHAEIVLVG